MDVQRIRQAHSMATNTKNGFMSTHQQVIMNQDHDHEGVGVFNKALREKIALSAAAYLA